LKTLINLNDVPEWATWRRNIQSSKATNALGCSTFTHLQYVLKKANGNWIRETEKNATKQPLHA